MLPNRVRPGPLDLHTAEGLWRWMQGVQRFLDNFTLTPPLMGTEGRIWLDPVLAAQQLGEGSLATSFLARITAVMTVSGRYMYSWIKVSPNGDGTTTDITGAGSASGGGGTSVTISPTITAGSAVLTGVAGTGLIAGMVLIAPDGGPFPLGTGVLTVDEGSATVTLDQPASSSASANLTFAPQGPAYEHNNFQVAVDQIVRLFPAAVDSIFGQTFMFAYEAAGGGAAGAGGDLSYFRAASTSSLTSWYVALLTPYSFANGAIQNSVPINNLLRGLPFTSPRGGTLSDIAVYCGGFPDAAAFARLGIYEAIDVGSGNLYPGPLVADCGQIALSAMGIRSLPCTVTLQPNKLYYLASLFSIPGITNVYSYQLTGSYVGSEYIVLGQTDNWAAVNSYQIGYSVVQAFGALPATFPAGGSLLLLDTNDIQAIGVKYSG